MEETMGFLRNRFNLLALVCYVVEFSVIVGVIGILYPDKDTSFLSVLGLGALIGLMFWTFGKIGRALWNMNEGWSWKLFVSMGALFVPVSILIFDLNAKLVVSHLYTGSKPIPYTFLNSAKKSTNSVRSQLAEIECTKCRAKILDEPGPLNCHFCGALIRE
jgi:hypothetical protein